MLVDDSSVTQKVAGLVFANAGISVVSVPDGSQAVDRFREILPDIVLADVNSDGISGYEFCEIIKSETSPKNVPVILLSGSFEPFDKDEAYRVGADAFLTKPFESVPELSARVIGLIGLHNGRSRTFAAPDFYPDAESVEPNSEHFDTLKMPNAMNLMSEFGDGSSDDSLIEAVQHSVYQKNGRKTDIPVELLDEIVNRVAERITDDYVRDTARRVVSEVVDEFLQGRSS
ncbi:MAG: response regulator [Pyrinomonadaceae bacterium]